ncbi:SGNH/GDSL hydrolase family protein [Actinomycetospora sp. CA-101289]|uniref:SGNH/GDSL hydrolase family protein n=1 Tax=Actinomycetospora sp. CA-101289 TaxID=3239893 RepID=UPI003D977F4E
MIAGRYVALGSSFAAGPGIPPLVHRGALRSARNYPHLLADARGLDLVDATCSGATTADVRHRRQPTLTGALPPQVDALTPDTALVTVTIGGNDLGYLGMLTSAALRGALARRLPATLARRLRYTVEVPPPATFAEVRASLGAVVGEVRRRAPAARVVLVDYLTVLGPHATPQTLPLTADQIEAGRRVAAGLAEVFAGAATDTGADLVAASEASTDHGAGSPDPWIGGVALGVAPLGGPVPFHPTAAGMRAVADLVAARL